MRYVYAIIMLVCCILAFFYATRVFYNKNYKRVTYRMFALLSVASGMWSLGQCIMFHADNVELYNIFRAVGFVGIISYMVFGQIVIGILSGYGKRIRPVIIIEAVIGIVVFALFYCPENYVLSETDAGIVIKYTNKIVALIYSLYCILVEMVFIHMSLIMIRKKNPKRIRAFGKAILFVQILVLLGIVIDLILKAFGSGLNIPVSSMLQFLGLEIIYYSVHRFNRNEISMQNMTGYIYNSLRSPVLVFDTDNVLRLTNREADEFFDLGSDEVSRDCFWNDIFGIEAPKLPTDKGLTAIFDEVYKKKDITCRLSVNSICDEYGDGIGYIVVVTDMTGQINNMKVIEQAKVEAENANKAKSMFLANMSHELRTPMNSIIGFAELGIRNKKDETDAEYFINIRDSAEAMLAIINGILDISKIESGKMELVNDTYYPARMFKDVSLIINMQAIKKNLEFEINVAPDFPNKMFGDKIRIREILINLLNNAVKYTKEGKVTLDVEMLSKNDNTARVRFRITDTGIGIKEDDLTNIFESFKRVDLNLNRMTEGTGLGLSITKGFVDMMGGELKVESVYGEGSVFTVEIDQKVLDYSPIESDITHQEEAAPKKQIKFKDIKVLAVDDNKINLKVISNIMKMYGIDNDTADSGKKAVELCRNNYYDIVLMDQMMPVMDGVTAMKEIRALGRGYEKGGTGKIIILTANTLNGAREEMLKRGFDEFLGKPVNFEVLEKQFVKLLPEDKYYYE